MGMKGSNMDYYTNYIVEVSKNFSKNVWESLRDKYNMVSGTYQNNRRIYTTNDFVVFKNDNNDFLGTKKILQQRIKNYLYLCALVTCNGDNFISLIDDNYTNASSHFLVIPRIEKFDNFFKVSDASSPIDYDSLVDCIMITIFPSKKAEGEWNMIADFFNFTIN